MRLIVLSIFIWVCSSITTDAQTVYVTKTGSKYHKESCHYLKYSMYTISLPDAKKKSYVACKVCKPSTTVTREAVKIDSPKAVPTPATIKVAASKQCSVIAKSTGNRCKRMTKSASGKCWQHEGLE